MILTYFNLGDQEWAREAACAATDDEVFFSPDVEGTPTGEELGQMRMEIARRDILAKTRYCSRCPSRGRCATEGWNQEHGTWGGWSPAERAQINAGVYRQSPVRTAVSPRRDEAVRLVREGLTIDDVAVKMEIASTAVVDYLRQNWALTVNPDGHTE